MVEPFLPEHAVTQPQPSGTSKGGAKSLGLWIVLICLLVAAWQLIRSSGPRGEMHAEERAGDYFGWAVAFGVLFLASVALMAWFSRTYVGSRNLHLRLEVPNRAYALGRYAEAVTSLRALHESTRHTNRTTVATHLVRALIRSGSFAEARGLCVELERNGNVLHTGVLRALAAANLAFTYALAGDTETAHRWLRETWARLAKVSDGERTAIGLTYHSAKAIVLLREGDAEAALAHLESSWDDFRGTLTARELVALEVLRRFAQSQRGLRAHVDPTPLEGPNDAAWLGAEWPEIRTFLQTLS